MNVMLSEIHLFVIWERAFQHIDFILNTIKANMEIVEIYKYKCSFLKSVDIQKRLYEIPSETAIDKCIEHSFANFIVVIVRIPCAVYITVNAHWGEAIVENTMYTVKENLRKTINLPFCIHGTINSIEAEHDIYVLTQNSTLYYANFPLWNETIKEITL